MTAIAAIAGADVRLFRLARTTGHTPAVERAVRVFSRSGEHAAAWMAFGAAGAAVDARRRERWVKGLVAVAAAYVLNTAIKLVVRRRRPMFEGLPALISTTTQLSFPSAHAASSTTAARVYAPLLPRGPMRVLLRATAAAMAGSRVYLGVHYPSDIAAGAALGALVGGVAR